MGKCIFFQIGPQEWIPTCSFAQGFMEILWGVLEGKILRFYSPSIWVEKQPYCLPFPYRCSSNVYQIFGHSNGSLDR